LLFAEELPDSDCLRHPLLPPFAHVGLPRIVTVSEPRAAAPTSSTAEKRTSTIDRLHLGYSTPQEAELVAFRVGEHMPWLHAGLPNVGWASASRQQPL
jgi:hypothetical protein